MSIVQAAIVKRCPICYNSSVKGDDSTVSYYTYILRCEDGSLYTGITTDLARRFREHSREDSGRKGARYTGMRRPLGFAAAWRGPDRAAASRLEWRIKQLARPEKLRLIEGADPPPLELDGYERAAINERGEFNMLFVWYPKCSTCKKAKAFLDAKGASYVLRDIKEDKPKEGELRLWQERSGMPLKRFFNTSGLQYKALGLKDKLPEMTEAEQIALLATDGMLVKRPILVGEDFVLTGFNEDKWNAAIK